MLTVGCRIEVDPRLAHDTDKTIQQAIELWKIVNRTNLLIKIPATLGRGCRQSPPLSPKAFQVNVTLIFSVERHRAVMDAYLAGLKKAKGAGHDLSKYSFRRIVLRVPGGHRDRQAGLDKIGTDEALALHGQTGVANARLAYAAYEEVFVGGSRYEALKADGCPRPAAAVGVDRRQEPGVLRHPVCHRTGRPRTP